MGWEWDFTAQLSVYLVRVFDLDVTIFVHMDDLVVTPASTFRFRIGPCVYSASPIRTTCYGTHIPTHGSEYDSNKYHVKPLPGPLVLASHREELAKKLAQCIIPLRKDTGLFQLEKHGKTTP